jgi:hypothetical protein
MVLTREDLNLLKQLKASGERGRIIQALEILERLGSGGYVVRRAAGGGALVNLPDHAAGRRRHHRTRRGLVIPRRFPRPWDIEEINRAAFVVRDNNGTPLAYVYFEDEPGRRTTAKPLTRDEGGGSLPYRQPAGVAAALEDLWPTRELLAPTCWAVRLVGPKAFASFRSRVSKPSVNQP